MTANFSWAKGVEGKTELKIIAQKCIERGKVVCIGFLSKNKKITCAYAPYDKSLNDETAPALLKEYGYNFSAVEIVTSPIPEGKPPKKEPAKRGGNMKRIGKKALGNRARIWQ